MKNLLKKANGIDCASSLNKSKIQAMKRDSLDEMGKLQYALRYLGTGWKSITVNEVKDILDEGLGLFLFYESNPTHDSYFSANRGKQDAEDAKKLAKSINLPQNVGICYTVDEGTKDFKDVLTYFQAIKQDHNGYPVGCYADDEVISFLQKHNACDYYIQTYAWSSDKTADNLAAYQFKNAQNLGGVEVDLEMVFDDKYAWKAEHHVPAPKRQTKASHIFGSYIVKAGNTLSGIGAKLGIAWQKIAKWNHIRKPFIIHPGEKLRLHAESQSHQNSSHAYVVQKGDSLSKIGKKLNVPWRKIADANGLHDPYIIYPGQKLLLPGAHHQYAPHLRDYTVQSGDSLSKIGVKLSVDWHKLSRLNHISSPYTIYPGETLKY